NIRYGDLKKQLAEDMVQLVAPIRNNIHDLMKNEEYLKKVVRDGAEQARQSADATLQAAKKAIGIHYF
ncbi:MAG TPA: tryptophan--tRNA ligase, partial [Chitinophagales bacterium]|nr:tryptophan--tRNA ligase [Chitinophagales bacterium]